MICGPLAGFLARPQVRGIGFKSRGSEVVPSAGWRGKGCLGGKGCWGCEVKSVRDIASGRHPLETPGRFKWGSMADWE